MGLSPFNGVGTGPKIAAPVGAADPGAGVAGGKEPGFNLGQRLVKLPSFPVYPSQTVYSEPCFVSGYRWYLSAGLLNKY